MFRPHFSLFAISVLLLVACNQATEPTTPGTPPTNAPRALIYGMAVNPVFEALRSKLRMTQWDGSQEPADFDLVVLDGDDYGAQELREDELIQKAIRGGVWVLSLDVDEEQKLEGIGHLLGAGTPDRSHAYLVRLTQGPNGHPTSIYRDFPDQGADADRQAERVVSYVNDKGLQSQQSSQDQEPNQPAKGSLAWTHEGSQSWDIVLPPTDHPNQSVMNERPQPQTAPWTQDYTIRIYLENDSANPMGTSQRVAIEQKGEAKPSYGGFAMYYNWCNSSCPTYPYGFHNFQIAWAQTQFATAAAISGGLFDLTDTSPANQNGASTVTTSSGFTIGVNADGPEATYTYGTSATRVISDWKVSNDSVPSANQPSANWRFASANPWDGFVTDGWDEDAGTGTTDYSVYASNQLQMADPNPLTEGTYAYATSSVWQLKSSTPSTATVFIGGTDSAWFTNAMMVDSYYTGQYRLIRRYQNSQQWGLNVNLGAVVPVPFEPGGFGVRQSNGTVGNEITAGQPAIGVVTLAAPANADAIVYLNALTNDYGVTIPTDSITIPKGETTGTFQIQSAALCVASNEPARLTAFFGSQLSQELTVVKPPSCN